MIDIHVCDDRFIILARHMGRPDAAKPEDFLDALKELQENAASPISRCPITASVPTNSIKWPIMPRRLWRDYSWPTACL